MSTENVEIWRASVERVRTALAAGSSPEDTIDFMADVWDPDIEWDATEAPAVDLQRVYHGADEVRRFWQEWYSAWETLRFDYEMLGAGEMVVMLLELHMRGRSTGIEMPFGEFAWVARFKGGRAVHVKLYMSQSEALEAAGLADRTDS